MTIIILLIGAHFDTATPAAVFTGETALALCLDTAATYEEPAACVPPTADVVPMLGLRPDGSLRPVARPEGL